MSMTDKRLAWAREAAANGGTFGCSIVIDLVNEVEQLRGDNVLMSGKLVTQQETLDRISRLEEAAGGLRDRVERLGRVGTGHRKRLAVMELCLSDLYPDVFS